MRRGILAIATALVIVGCSTPQESTEDYSKYVNPFMGTDGPGNVYPGAQVPFGMVQLSPDNAEGGWDRISGYFYPDSVISSFSMTHLSGTGAGDLYDIAFMPAISYNTDIDTNLLELNTTSTFSHNNESAHPGYYSVLLNKHNIKVELSATERCGIQRYTYTEAPKEGGLRSVYLNLARAINWDYTTDSFLEVIDSVTVAGYRYSSGWATDQKIYFTTKFSQPIVNHKIDKKEILSKADKSARFGYVARFDFDNSTSDPLVVITAISPTSTANAAENLKAEATTWNFNDYSQAAAKKWNTELSKIEAQSTNITYKELFYTALYQSMLAPTLFMDINGDYRGPDLATHNAQGWTNYSTFSLWDTYRAAHPLYTIMHTERVSDMVNSFLAFYKQHGRLPVWNLYGNETDMMIGYHSVPVIVDAYLKGIGGFNYQQALEACVATANADDYRSIGLYKSLGYVPYDKEEESVSKTLEYAYDDWAIAQMALGMGQDSIYQVFINRAQNYRNVYNPGSTFMQPRDSKGNWISGFDPKAYTKHITESNAWQYTWYAPQDVEGLIAIMGGKERFTQKLDSMFTFAPLPTDTLPIFSTGMIGQYAHGNEPSHHVAYLYNWTQEPWKTQKYVREILLTQYKNEPYGHCGNEDCGQMSSWFIFSSMGFYPVDPISGVYAIGSPLMDKVVINLPSGKTFTITAKENSPENIYIESVKLNGVKLPALFIKHTDIMNGGTLEFKMSSNPQIK